MIEFTKEDGTKEHIMDPKSVARFSAYGNCEYTRLTFTDGITVFLHEKVKDVMEALQPKKNMMTPEEIRALFNDNSALSQHTESYRAGYQTALLKVLGEEEQ